MFQQLKSSALKTAYNFARKKGIHCPDCEEPLDLPRAMPLEEKNETISCDQCSWFGTPSVLLYESTGKAFSDNDRKRRGGLIAHPVAKPANSKIKETTDGQLSSPRPQKNQRHRLLRRLLAHLHHCSLLFHAVWQWFFISPLLSHSLLPHLLRRWNRHGLRRSPLSLHGATPRHQ